MFLWLAATFRLSRSRFSAGFAAVTRNAVNRREVVVVVAAAEMRGRDVVNLVGTWPLAHVADTIVTVEDAWACGVPVRWEWGCSPGWGHCSAGG